MMELKTLAFVGLISSLLTGCDTTPIYKNPTGQNTAKFYLNNLSSRPVALQIHDSSYQCKGRNLAKGEPAGSRSVEPILLDTTFEVALSAVTSDVHIGYVSLCQLGFSFFPKTGHSYELKMIDPPKRDSCLGGIRDLSGENVIVQHRQMTSAPFFESGSWCE
ncbi:hypothetical protein [Aquirhabdus parva]|uniref:Lipoprotein n=1 Tax=Aquirhabdus parva TaxID=2283318 RepID=A0A345P8Y2_9GAMM|nr:hypothetical protein [Aquirhabdus parva]AXI03741.1 hypothetical protein HYN46_13400 [Aquirhabdus parva]